ncbi:MAG TPA: hypothetical protein VFE84_11040 [Patescibacteria group bacterium]|nr:hypothetical protein [Patescibacteria group bacterium]
MIPSRLNDSARLDDRRNLVTPIWPALRRYLPGMLLPLIASAQLTSAATPGEATELNVVGYDALTGNLAITYQPACSAANHHIEYGPLSAVSTLGYTGQDCAIGTSGSYASFNPGPGSFFFLVVGDDGAGIEGSYGTSLVNGVPAERPEDTLDPVCAFTQNLSQRCDGPFAPNLSINAFRPATGTSGAPFQRWPIGSGEKLSPGAGIRVNGDDDDADGLADRDDSDVPSENDLVEVTLSADPFSPPAGFEYTLTRSNANIRVWSTPTKNGEILASGSTVPVSFSSTTRSVWIENPGGGAADLDLSAREIASGSVVALDRVHFFPFTSLVIALGGESQVPADPPLEPTNHGTFQLAITLYRMGYDVHMYDEDVVNSSGAGAAYNEVVSAIQKRQVTRVAIYGYSHGGGSTNDLAVRLNANRATIGAFTIDFTAYVDGIDNKSDFDIDTETALPASTLYHANYYEHPGCGFLQLCGGPIAGANLNVNVTATPWGGSLTHFTIDDAPQVLQGILDLLVAHVAQ